MGQSESTSKVTVQWEWQSNPHPWSSEPKQWTPYGPPDNVLLETAYQNKKKKVELGEFIVFIKGKEMMQRRKNDAQKQRRVRRKVIQKDLVRKKRFFGAETPKTPKTYNNVFGGLEHFLTFFESRGPEIKEFAVIFKEIEEAQDMNRLNQKILPLLINSIVQEAGKSKQKHGEKKIVDLLQQRTYTALQEFYGDILKVYTMETFLYPNLNEYLRNEDWDGLGYLLPYAFCLCKAFFWPDIITGSASHNNSNQTNNEQSNKIILYRGAALDKDALSFYESNTSSTFAWNGITSTSTKRTVAEAYMKAKGDKIKIPVMFLIETSLFPDELKTLKWIDIKPFSVYPTEDEIILGPGSTFELIKFQRDEKGIEINLRLVSNVSALAHQGQIMHGVLYAAMGSDRAAKIGCLEGKELEEAIAHLKGNKLVEELELISLHFDIDGLAKLRVTLSTLTNLKRLVCSSLSSKEKKHLEIILEALKEQKMLVTLEICDDSLENEEIMNSFAKKLGNLVSLTTLSIDFELSKMITNKGLSYLSSEGIRYLTSIKTLSLNFEWCQQITNEGITSLCSEGIRPLTSLTTLSLNFEGCFGITDEGITILGSQGIRYLTSLTALALNFCACTKITDKGITSLCSKGIRYLTSLTALTLNFKCCKNTTDEGITNLCSQGIRYLTSLTTLILNFNSCEKITNEGVNSLFSEGIRLLTSLTILNLNFGVCHKITDKGITSLCSEVIRGQASIKTLNLHVPSHLSHLNNKLRFEGETSGILVSINESVNAKDSNNDIFHFRREVKIQPVDGNIKQKLDKISISSVDTINIDSQDKLTKFYLKYAENNQTVKALTVDGGLLVSSQELLKFCSKGLRDLTLLTTLTLNFEACEYLTSEGITSLCSQGIRHLTSLTALNLNFGSCEQITDEEITILCSEGIRHLALLTILNLNCAGCLKISDEGISSLCSQGIRHLTSLTTLSLNFEWCKQITDKGITSLCSQGIRHLTSLTTLSLNFEGCFGITDEGIACLGSQGIRYLTSLTTLALNFCACAQITNQGIISICSERIRYLTSLITLSLNFEECEKITDDGINSLCSEGIRHLTSLTTLSLDFAYCLITDKGITSLCSEGIRHLTSLTALTLSFHCVEITDNGITSLCSEGIRHLTSLTTLSLNFEGGFGITDEGIACLGSQGIRYLTSLTALALNFCACTKITDQGITSFCSEGIRYLTSLKDLTLNFKCCKNTTDEGITCLCSEGLRHLTSLATLSLNFQDCEQITDEGITSLCSQGIRHLTSLTILTLDFRYCDLSFQGLTQFIRFLKYFGFNPQSS